jgi:hypothetical protein
MPLHLRNGYFALLLHPAARSRLGVFVSKEKPRRSRWGLLFRLLHGDLIAVFLLKVGHGILNLFPCHHF